MSPDAVTCIVKVRQEYLERGQEDRAEQELDSLVAETMAELIATGRYVTTQAGDAALQADAYRFLASMLQTATTHEITTALLKWHHTSDVLIDHDAR